MRTALLQDWITVQSDGTQGVGTFTQAQGEWLDVSSFAAVTAWIDVTQVLPGPGGLSVTLALQTSPTLDEPYFEPIASISNLTAGTSPQVLQSVRTPGTVPLARYLRWQLTVADPSDAPSWGATFRIRVAPSLESFFVPTDIGGCVLWLRADLGITLAGGTNVSAWADQSGQGNNASQSVSGSRPVYKTSAMNGAPALVGDGSAAWMQTSAFTLGASATLFAAVQPSTATQAGYTRLLEQRFDETYYLGCTSAGTAYKLIVDDPTPPYGAASGGTVTAGVNTIVSAVYPYPAGKGSLYVNGSAVASDTFTAPTPTSLQLAIMQNYGNSPATYWDGYFAEAIIYDRNLTVTEMARVHRYLAGRYGVAM